jgi:spermidine synthase
MSHQACPNRRRIVRLLPSRVRLHRPRRRSLDGPPFARVSLLVFVVGASSLGTEIAAARLLAPYFGASTIVWANTIAIVLVALSLGYWIGGLLARGQPTYRLLCLVTLLAGVGLATVPFVARPFLNVWVNALAALDAGAFIGSLLGVLVLVAVPVLLLGIAAPLAIRLTVATVEESGSKAGRLYAISTLGSLSGTFLSALLLIQFVGTHRTFLAFALALSLTATTGLPRRYLLVPLAVALVLLAPQGRIKPGVGGEGRVIHERETAYHYARVIEAPDGTRRLELNEGVVAHSLYVPGTYLTHDYWDDFLALPRAALQRRPSSVAILGNAGGTVARAYGHYFPSTRVDAVEIDSRLAAIGRRFFGLRGPRLRIIAADARPFLRSTENRYDAIFIDAYRQPYIPFYLTTRKFFALCRARPAPGGVVIVNVGHPADSNRLELALSATMRSVFPNVVRDPVQPTNSLTLGSVAPATAERLRAAAAAMPDDLRDLTSSIAARLRPAMRGGPVFTDDRAPVEWLIDGTIVQYAAGRR